MTTEPAWYNEAELIAPDTLKSWGTTLVIAPHQDDESLGCGGTIAMLCAAGNEVFVLFTSDGSMSHPGSRSYPAEKLTLLREKEAIAALAILGVEERFIRFMRLKDSKLPAAGNEGFEAAADDVAALIKAIKPATILIPWRRDPHQDHRSTWQITDVAVKLTGLKVTMLEYFVWLWERAVPGEYPEKAEGRLITVDIKKYARQKSTAIKAHVSQTTGLIADDPEGFTLAPHMIEHFENANEFYFKEKHQL